MQNAAMTLLQLKKDTRVTSVCHICMSYNSMLINNRVSLQRNQLRNKIESRFEAACTSKHRQSRTKQIQPSMSHSTAQRSPRLHNCCIRMSPPVPSTIDGHPAQATHMSQRCWQPMIARARMIVLSLVQRSGMAMASAVV